jgi:hypothetical protein
MFIEARHESMAVRAGKPPMEWQGLAASLHHNILNLRYFPLTNGRWLLIISTQLIIS